MELIERLKKFKEEEDVSYKSVAQEVGISISTIYNFTSGIRNLKPKLERLLDEYLTNKGY